MKLHQLLELLAGWDPEMDVQLRIEGQGAADGDYLTIAGEQSVHVEYGKITIIGDVPDD